jgi:SAM-dependent methyltransferase
MLDGWWDVVGCPYCRGALQSTNNVERPIGCLSCGERFAVADGIPVLLRHQDADRLAGFSRSYQEERLREGRLPLSVEQAQALPYGQPPGFPSLYWEVRRQSFCALMRWLAREGPSPAGGPTADLGGGIGWLGYRLAQLRFRVLAVDASRDEAFGLEAARTYYSSLASFLPIQGDLEHPPLQAGRLSLIVCNASLHYASDLESTLQRVADALRPGGHMVILDTPIARHPRPGTGRGDRHLGRQELHSALLDAGLRPRRMAVQRGWRWRMHQVKALLRGDARFSFPMIVAERTL